jgi:hypothetical protein
MNINKLIKEELTDIQKQECDKYFDIDSIYKTYVEFSMPLYSIINKRKTAKLIYITPDQYIYNIARGFGLSYHDALSPVMSNLVDKYAEDILKGDKFPVPYFRDNKEAQEGRHRAMAAKKIGCKYIPVIKFIDVSNPMLSQYKGDTFDEVNESFIEKGFKNGISKKCYYDLQRYFENI